MNASCSWVALPRTGGAGSYWRTTSMPARGQLARAAQLDGVVEDAREIDGRGSPRRSAAARGAACSARSCGCAAPAPRCRCEQRRRRVAGGQIGEQQLDDAQHAGQRVVDLVRHARAQLAERRQRARAQQQVLRLAQLARLVLDALLEGLVPRHDLVGLLRDLLARRVQRRSAISLKAARQIAQLVAAVLGDARLQVAGGDLREPVASAATRPDSRRAKTRAASEPDDDRDRHPEQRRPADAVDGHAARRRPSCRRPRRSPTARPARRRRSRRRPPLVYSATTSPAGSSPSRAPGDALRLQLADARRASPPRTAAPRASTSLTSMLASTATRRSSPSRLSDTSAARIRLPPPSFGSKATASTTCGRRSGPPRKIGPDALAGRQRGAERRHQPDALDVGGAHRLVVA